MLCTGLPGVLLQVLHPAGWDHSRCHVSHPGGECLPTLPPAGPPSLAWGKPCQLTGCCLPPRPSLLACALAPQFEADRRAFIITINSFGTELSKEDRAKLFPHCGRLYPEGLAQLARADDYEQVKNVADYYPVSALAVERWAGIWHPRPHPIPNSTLMLMLPPAPRGQE